MTSPRVLPLFLIIILLGLVFVFIKTIYAEHALDLTAPTTKIKIEGTDCFQNGIYISKSGQTTYCPNTTTSVTMTLACDDPATPCESISYHIDDDGTDVCPSPDPASYEGSCTECDTTSKNIANPSGVNSRRTVCAYSTDGAGNPQTTPLKHEIVFTTYGRSWIQITGDVHSNTSINLPAAP